MLGQAAGEGDPGGKAWGRKGHTPCPRELGPELAGGNRFESPRLRHQSFIKSLFCVGCWRPKGWAGQELGGIPSKENTLMKKRQQSS